MLADYHVHSEFSDDSTYPVRMVCDDAVRLDLAEICFTDHVDYGVKQDVGQAGSAHPGDGAPVPNVDYERYFPALEDAADRFAGELAVRRGLELGVQVHTIGRFEALLDRWRGRMDFAILSIHQINDQELWTGAFQQGLSQAEYNEAYYRELLDVVERFDGYSVLGHLDLIKRYDPAGALPFERSRDIIAAILETVISHGKGIEINTSALRYGLTDMHPCAEILSLYRDLGGRVITLGSDSHGPGDLGAHLARASRRAARLGFREVYTFEGWEPRAHPLETA